MKNDGLKFKILHLTLPVCAFIFVFCFFIGNKAAAADIIISSSDKKFQAEQQFEVEIFIKTGSEDINAVEGKIVFPETLLNLKEIRDGGSIIGFWVERPKIQDASILFSGIIPGGYFGDKGLLFSAVFQTTQKGQAAIEAQDIKVFQNDGWGTEEKTAISNFQFVISKQISPIIISEIEDLDMPEIFEPIIASDPVIFDGKYFLVFATQDKGSGIDHYEIQEGKLPFVEAESPHLLQNQELDEKIFVKAVDKKGNERITAISPPQPAIRFAKFWIWTAGAALALGVIVICFIIIILWKKYYFKIK